MKIMPLTEIEYQKKSVDFFLEKFKSDNKKKLCDLIQTDRYIHTNSGKEAIRIIVEHLNLKKEDEVFITTTTESSFVSTCVSATLFNYSKISRVLTDKTKVVYVIHNFGFPHPKLLELRQMCDEKNLILIEDCAFAFDSYFGDIRLGSIGDFTIYSLSKILPVENGGVLVFNDKYFLKQDQNKNLESRIKKWIPKITSMKERRKENYQYLYNELKSKNSIYGSVKNTTPFMFGLNTQNYRNYYKKAQEVDIELGVTHVPNELHIPMNPFIEQERYKWLVEEFFDEY